MEARHMKAMLILALITLRVAVAGTYPAPDATSPGEAIATVQAQIAAGLPAGALTFTDAKAEPAARGYLVTTEYVVTIPVCGKSQRVLDPAHLSLQRLGQAVAGEPRRAPCAQ